MLVQPWVGERYKTEFHTTVSAAIVMTGILWGLFVSFFLYLFILHFCSYVLLYVQLFVMLLTHLFFSHMKGPSYIGGGRAFTYSI